MTGPRFIVWATTFEPGEDGQGDGVGGIEWRYDHDLMVSWFNDLARDLNKMNGHTLMRMWSVGLPVEMKSGNIESDNEAITDYLDDALIANDPETSTGDASLAQMYVTGRTGHSYEQQQIDRVLDDVQAMDDVLKLKIIGPRTSVETKWLNATPEQVRAIRAILGDE